jgi:hypothetical protein
MSAAYAYTERRSPHGQLERAQRNLGSATPSRIGGVENPSTFRALVEKIPSFFVKEGSEDAQSPGRMIDIGTQLVEIVKIVVKLHYSARENVLPENPFEHDA